MVSLIKILFIAVFLVDLVDGKCENIRWLCKGHLRRGPGWYKGHCKNYYVRRYCPKLCNDECDEDGVVTTPTTTTTTKTTTTTTTPPTTTTTIAPGNCKDNDNSCKGWGTYCRSSSYVKNNCRKTCGTCGTITTTTKKPTTTTTATKRPITTTTERPTITTTTTTPTTKRPTTTTTRKTTKAPTTEKPIIPSGGCADMKVVCFMKDIFNPALHCGKYGSYCMRSCNKCRGGNTRNEICANLKDRAMDCNSRNCRAGERVTRHRAHTKCARTCCQKNQLY